MGKDSDRPSAFLVIQKVATLQTDVSVLVHMPWPKIHRWQLFETRIDHRPVSSLQSLREAGWSNRRIGRHLGRSDMVVARCWQQWITEGRVYRRGGSGRPRNTNDREDRAIRRVATSAPTTSLASIQRHLPPSRHPVPSRETIRRRLTEVGLKSRRPLRRLPLTPHHRQCRHFCRPRAT
ncbi:HTH_38 domain-containing protein [Trichonephila clavipes]|nr:HTH_38 domain-containing protein [Trichonephila clavipes]